jgi:transcriptional regulator with XRE-family HTH domain
MPPRIDPNELFPAAPPHLPHLPRVGGRKGGFKDDERGPAKGRFATAREDVSTRWAAIYALELRNLSHAEIAMAMGLNPGTLSRITRDERYIAYREEHMAKLDSEFVAMKPLAFNALRSGLNSSDENTALRASEQWFKGAGFGGFAKDPVPATRTTAEDVAAALLAGVQVNVQVNVGKDE